MKSATNFKFEIATESEERYGEAILVRHTGSFTVEVKDEIRKYRVAVSYVIVREDDQLRIAHLHWSSRRDQSRATQP